MVRYILLIKRDSKDLLNKIHSLLLLIKNNRETSFHLINPKLTNKLTIFVDITKIINLYETTSLKEIELGTKSALLKKENYYTLYI